MNARDRVVLRALAQGYQERVSTLRASALREPEGSLDRLADSWAALAFEQVARDLLVVLEGREPPRLPPGAIFDGEVRS